jgi:hypothetical protein
MGLECKCCTSERGAVHIRSKNSRLHRKGSEGGLAHSKGLIHSRLQRGDLHLTSNAVCHTATQQVNVLRHTQRAVTHGECENELEKVRLAALASHWGSVDACPQIEIQISPEGLYPPPPDPAPARRNPDCTGRT